MCFFGQKETIKEKLRWYQKEIMTGSTGCFTWTDQHTGPDYKLLNTGGKSCVQMLLAELWEWLSLSCAHIFMNTSLISWS